MAEALFHSNDLLVARCKARPYISALLFKSRMENIWQCVGTGHSNPATVTIGTVTTLADTTVTDTNSTVPQVKDDPISYALERRKQGPRGFIGNLSRMLISG